MTLRIVAERSADLAAYASVSSAFLVDRRFDVTTVDSGLGGVSLTEVVVESPWLKDYDQINGRGPAQWSTMFDTTNWGVLACFDDDERVGGAVLAHRTPDCSAFAGRDDLVVLWDIRVRSDVRGRGVGRALFDAALAWSRERNSRHLTVETQNINIAACRFYVAMGCELVAINRWAYADLPDEVELDWIREV